MIGQLIASSVLALSLNNPTGLPVKENNSQIPEGNLVEQLRYFEDSEVVAHNDYLQEAMLVVAGMKDRRWKIGDMISAGGARLDPEQITKVLYGDVKVNKRGEILTDLGYMRLELVQSYLIKNLIEGNYR